MIYKVTAALFFTIDDEANDFFHDCEVAIAKATTINPGQPNSQQSFAQLQQCFHDEQPSKPCIVITELFSPP